MIEQKKRQLAEKIKKQAAKPKPAKKDTKPAQKDTKKECKKSPPVSLPATAAPTSPQADIPVPIPAAESPRIEDNKVPSPVPENPSPARTGVQYSLAASTYLTELQLSQSDSSQPDFHPPPVVPESLTHDSSFPGKPPAMQPQPAGQIPAVSPPSNGGSPEIHARGENRQDIIPPPGFAADPVPAIQEIAAASAELTEMSAESSIPGGATPAQTGKSMVQSETHTMYR